MDINKLNRIAKRVAAANDINIVETVIDGGNYNENDAIESIKNIINQSGNQEAKKLLEKMVKNSKTASNSKTAGVSEWINEIKEVAKNDSRILMALLAAGMIYVSVPAKAAENTLQTADVVSMENNVVTPVKDMAQWIWKDVSDYISQPERNDERNTNEDRNALRKKRSKMNGEALHIFFDCAKQDNITLEQAFKRVKSRLLYKYGEKNVGIIENSYKKYCDREDINPALVKCRMPSVEYKMIRDSDSLSHGIAKK